VGVGPAAPVDVGAEPTDSGTAGTEPAGGTGAVPIGPALAPDRPVEPESPATPGEPPPIA